MDIVPSDSRYIPLTQQRWCCVPTCIQMVMLRHQIPLMPAELMGYYMGLVVPPEELKFFWNGRTGEKPKSGYGTQKKKEYDPNMVFKKFSIPLKMTWSLIDKFPDIKSLNTYLSKVESKNMDIFVCCDWGTLFDDNYHGGHVCVIDRVYLNKSEIRIIDPEYKAPKWRIIKIDKLFEAMKFHGKDNSAGFWELSVTK
jgi:hypothetical protein